MTNSLRPVTKCTTWNTRGTLRSFVCQNNHAHCNHNTPCHWPVWAPDEEEIYLPAKVKATFRRGEAGVTVLPGPNKEEIPISAAQSAELKVVDEQCLQPIENMVMLNDLNNASLLHNLRIRFKRNEIYTNVGAILVAVNPFAMLPIYTPEWLDKYKQHASHGFNAG